MGQTKEMVKNRSMFLLALHVLVMVSMFLLAFSGGMRKIDDAVVRFCIELAGYTEKVDIVAIKEQEWEAVPILGAGVEQHIFLSEKMQKHKQLMLGLRMATYKRENQGTLYVDLVQENVCQRFQIEMEQIRDNGEMKLVFEPGQFLAGEIKLKIYAPKSTGENCVAIYAAENTKGYRPFIVNGEKMYKNAVIYGYVPSKHARIDFAERRDE